MLLNKLTSAVNGPFFKYEAQKTSLQMEVRVAQSCIIYFYGSYYDQSTVSRHCLELFSTEWSIFVPVFINIFMGLSSGNTPYNNML